MASKNIQSLMKSLLRTNLGCVYELPDVRDAVELLEATQSFIDNPSGDITDDDKAEYEKTKNLVEKLRSREENIQIKFRFQKLTTSEFASATEFFNTEANRHLGELIRTKLATRKQQIKSHVENEGAVAVASGQADNPADIAKNLVIDAILETEGKTKEWAESVDEDDIEMQLSEQQEKDLELDISLPEDEYVRRVQVREEYIQSSKTAKRANIIEMRERDISDRREALSKQDIDKLINSLAVLGYKQESDRYAMAKLQDYFIFNSACNPDDMEVVQRGDLKRTVMRRHFSSIDEVTALRESEDDIAVDLYAWMLAKYNELQFVSNQGDVRRVAESASF